MYTFKEISQLSDWIFQMNIDSTNALNTHHGRLWCTDTRYTHALAYKYIQTHIISKGIGFRNAMKYKIAFRSDVFEVFSWHSVHVFYAFEPFSKAKAKFTAHFAIIFIDRKLIKLIWTAAKSLNKKIHLKTDWRPLYGCTICANWDLNVLKKTSDFAQNILNFKRKKMYSKNSNGIV